MRFILHSFQGTQHEGDVRRECTASLAICMLLLLKQHLKAAYSLTNERISSFNPGQLLPLAVWHALHTSLASVATYSNLEQALHVQSQQMRNGRTGRV